MKLADFASPQGLRILSGGQLTVPLGQAFASVAMQAHHLVGGERLPMVRLLTYPGHSAKVNESYSASPLFSKRGSARSQS